MSETKINSSLSSKFKKTQVNCVQKLPDITGRTLGAFYMNSRLDIVSGEADIYLCSGTGSYSGKKFLLKYYRRENAVKPDVLEKLKGVNSPFVAPVEGFGEYQGHQYVVRPYYEMSALSELLAEGTRFSEDELKTLIIPSIIEGLKAVHDAGILHKDLKPANLIPDDAGEHIVLIDFGISTDTGKNTFVVTQTGMTPLYAAPEAMQGIFHRETDYYALGITIFELFTGFTPFQNPGLSPEEVARLASISKIEFPEGFPENLRKLVLGLTCKDISHRNEKDNPNRRWGYDEVRRWLQGEDVPVPGEGKETSQEPKFLPYSFDGIRYTDIQNFVRAMLKHPEAGLRELRRGILAHHFGLFDSQSEILCSNAEEQLQKTDDAVQTRGIFYRLMYSLAPGLTCLYCKGREFQDLKELGCETFNAALLQDQGFCKELTLLQKSFLEYYASAVIKNPVFSGIIKNIGELISHNRYTEEQTAWIIGYAFTEKKNVRIHGENFSDVENLREHLEKLELENGFVEYVKYVEESRQELEFFAFCYPDKHDRLYFSEILKDLDRAIFGNGELQFRDARDFDNYVGKLLKEKQVYRLRSLHKRYGTALKEVSEKIWNTSSYDDLNNIVSGFADFEEQLLGSAKWGNDYFAKFVDENQDSPDVLREFVRCHKSILTALEKRPDLSQAIRKLRVASDSSDSEKQGCITIKGIRYPTVKSITVREGDYIKFGNYPLKKNGGKSPIEWLVLEALENEALLISRYGIDCRRYHHFGNSTSWEKSTLRKWLNNNFLKVAFSDEEMERIKVSELRNDDNPKYKTHGGNSTEDRVFCLSIAEAEQYFENDTARKCQPTDYALNKGACVDDNGCCFWWLRSPGFLETGASSVYMDGGLYLIGDSVSYSHYAVRPALRIILHP